MTALTTREAAKRLGVKVETLYAYVSRGLIERHVSEDGRTSMFDHRAVEDLARRGRPRQSSRSTSLNMLIETRLTSISPHGVRYRGLWSSELAMTRPFEDVAELLWMGELPVRRLAPWEGKTLSTGSHEGVRHELADSVRLIAARTMAELPRAGGFDAASVAGSARAIIATITDSLPAAGHQRVPRLGLPGSANEVRGFAHVDARPTTLGGTIAGRLWTKLSPHRPQAGMLAVLNAALVLLADHELAASTLAVRVAASTRADPTAAVCTGLGVLSGPLHGGASVTALAMLERAATVGAARAVSEILEVGRQIPGFGHRVYVESDPRAVVLIRLLRATWGRTRLLTIVDDVHAEVLLRIDQAPNIDFALAAMVMLGGMPADGAEVVMAIARIAGWLAHAIEEYGEAPLRFRPRASYIGN